jgi:Mg-chelatase subunit ChlD
MGMTKKEKQARQDKRMLDKLLLMTPETREQTIKKANKQRKQYLKNLLAGAVQAAVNTPTPAPAQITTPTLPKKNHVAIIVDESGSMSSLRDLTIKAVNTQIDIMRDEAKKTGQETTATFVTFGRRSTIHEIFFQRDISRLNHINENDYHPDGMTPMFDAVGTTIDKMLGQRDAEEENVSFLFVVITDGQENHSHRYNRAQLVKLMKDCQNKDRWSFAWLVPQGDKAALVGMGIPDGNVMEWEQTSAGIKAASAAMSVGTQSFYQSRSLGQRSVRNYFVTDMANVDPAEVRRRCANISNQVQFAATNGKRETIRDFCEREFRTSYRKGAGFYELVKPETVQSYKKIIIVDKVNGDVYGGPDARSILGLPNYEVRVRPGDHGNWTLYVQSTSFNRMLPPKTKLAYWSAAA